MNRGARLPKRRGGGNGQTITWQRRAYRPAYRARDRGSAGRRRAGAVLLRGAPTVAQPRPQPMTVIDSQVHAYEANTPKRPWFRVPNWPAHVTGDEMVAAMDKVGVDGAIFISPFSMYRYDGSY